MSATRRLLWTLSFVPLLLLAGLFARVYVFTPVDAAGERVYVCGAAGAGFLCIGAILVGTAAALAFAAACCPPRRTSAPSPLPPNFEDGAPGDKLGP